MRVSGCGELRKLKLRLGITSSAEDERLYVLLDAAEDTVLDIIGRERLPARLESVTVALAEIAYNRQGTEGEGSRGEGGVSISYIDGLPADLQQRLRNYPRKVGVMRRAPNQAEAGKGPPVCGS